MHTMHVAHSPLRCIPAGAGDGAGVEGWGWGGGGGGGVGGGGEGVGGGGVPVLEGGKGVVVPVLVVCMRQMAPDWPCRSKN